VPRDLCEGCLIRFALVCRPAMVDSDERDRQERERAEMSAMKRYLEELMAEAGLFDDDVEGEYAAQTEDMWALAVLADGGFVFEGKELVAA
jgi:hypothetical protein